MEKTETVFTLAQKIEFSNREIGDLDQGFEITMRAPTYKDLAYVSLIEQHFHKAFSASIEQRAAKMTDAQRADAAAQKDIEGESKVPSISPSEVLLMISMHGDMPECLRDFEALALRVCSWNAKTPLVKRHLEDMAVSDYRRMLGEYLSFFIVPSALSEMERAFSDS